jgi:hypothetical protein
MVELKPNPSKYSLVPPMTLPWRAVVVAAFWRVTVLMLKPEARLKRRAITSNSLNLVINIA